MKLYRNLFVFFLACLAVKDLSLGSALLFKLEWLSGVAKMSFSSDITVLATFFGVCVLIVSSLCVLAIRWVLQDKAEGFGLGKFIGWWMVIASIIVYFKIERLDYTLIDFISGVLILIPGYLKAKKA